MGSAGNGKRRPAAHAHGNDLRATRSRNPLPAASRKTSTDSVQLTYGTLPEASRRFGIGLKKLRQLAAKGAFPVYSGETAWLRVKLSEVEAWLRSTRVPITQHACQRVEEVLAREEALDLRLAEAETHADRLDGLCGPISDAAKPYSEAIDRIEADRQALLAEGDVG